jgi:site-specific recombinase XerD
MWREAQLGATYWSGAGVLAWNLQVRISARIAHCRARWGRPMKRRKLLDADLLTGHEVEALIRVCSNRAPTGIRNRALIALAWRTGLRLGEVLSLGPKDLDLRGGMLVVQRGKGGKRRIVGMDAGTIALIERWLEARKRRGINSRAPVFCTLTGEELDQSYIRHLLPRLARKAGIDKRVHAHALRHCYAVELEREGASVSTIRDLLGHSSLAVTDRYLRRIGAGEAVDFARQREWKP